MVRLSPADTLVAFTGLGHTANRIGSRELATVQGEPLSILWPLDVELWKFCPNSHWAVA